MMYAYQHVSTYNYLLAENTQKIFFMEDIVLDPAGFYKKLGLHKESDIQLEMHQGHSHKKVVENYDFISGCENVLEKVVSLKLNFGGLSLNHEEIQKKLHQKSL